MRDRVAIVLGAIVAAMHLAVANRYDLFRDELYFIVCGRHPAFGYVDQPPLVPLLAAGSFALGHQTWLVRLPAVFAAAGLVWLVIAFVRLLGGKDGAAWIAGLAAGFAPMLVGLTATLDTTTFECLAWTLVAYGLARALLLDERPTLLWTGIVAGVAMECKYALPLWLAGLAIGIALGPERRLFRTRELWLGIALATFVALPSIVWQLLHGLPFAELVRNAGDKDAVVSPLAFAANQVVVFDPLFAPIWLSGLIAPFVRRDLRALRFVAIAFVISAVAIVAGHGKDYYLAAAYPPLFAIGGVALERLIRNARVRSAYLVVAVAVALIGVPLSLPILPPATLIAYQRAMHLQPDVQERGDAAAALPPTFADMFGWRDFVKKVASAYRTLPPEERARTAIVVDNYGEAAALDVYGGAYDLPPALSGHNQYFLWGTRGQTATNLLRIQRNPERLRPYCARTIVLGTTQETYGRLFENGKTIAFCQGVHPSLTKLWPGLKEFI